ncbi:MAG: hypothetical protein R3F59_08990 [Myxococcota bacterium]
MTDDDRKLRRNLAIEAFNATWDLIDKGAARTADEDQRMEHLAHTSRCLWELSGGAPANLARGEWQIAWVYAQLGRGEDARRFAERCLQRCEAGGEGFAPFDLPSALQALTAAAAVLGDTEARDRHAAAARDAAEALAPDDRAHIVSQIDEAVALAPR